MLSQQLWQPEKDQIDNSLLYHFISKINLKYQLNLTDYQDIYLWSVENNRAFWPELWDFCLVIGQQGDTVLSNPENIQHSIWFENGSLNFAENLLQRKDGHTAIIWQIEDKLSGSFSYKALYLAVARLAHYLRISGVNKGDRVAGYLPNIPEAIIAMLATTSIGAIWSSTSPDFGAESVIERFGQIKPKVLITATAYSFKGKVIDYQDKSLAVIRAIVSIETTIQVALLEKTPRFGEDWSQIQGQTQVKTITFEQVPFNHPLYILYSSGTTGKPKCIIHCTGGILLQHLKEHRLHCDIHPGDRVFYFTTCGWMMWNWLVSALASHASIMLFDGNPFYPDKYVLWRYAQEQNCTLFGTSAKYLETLNKQKARPINHYPLPSLRCICSTGSVLEPEDYDYVYADIKPDIQLSSISGGTDICSCFVLGNPISPVYRGVCQGRGLGMDVQVFDASGNRTLNQKGELVCCNSFPNQPLGFWNDPEDIKYYKAYYAHYPNTWRHGDWVELKDNGGVIFYGRSDATLNPGGVRIGTAEIYRYVEQFEEIQEAIAVGQSWENDERVVLFVKLSANAKLTEELIDRIKTRLRQQLTPRHSPAKILAVDDIPRTKSGKITELAVKQVIHGREVSNTGALANPECLAGFSNRSELNL